MSIRSYRDLIVWQLGMDLVEMVYTITREFPRHEIYGLVSQMRRAAVSIPSNIAEGHGRDSTKEFMHHVSYSMGSLAELETQLQLSVRLQYQLDEHVDKLLEDCDLLGRKLRGLQKSLKRKMASQSPASSPQPPAPK